MADSSVADAGDTAVAVAGNAVVVAGDSERYWASDNTIAEALIDSRLDDIPEELGLDTRCHYSWIAGTAAA